MMSIMKMKGFVVLQCKVYQVALIWVQSCCALPFLQDLSPIQNLFGLPLFENQLEISTKCTSTDFTLFEGKSISNNLLVQVSTVAFTEAKKSLGSLISIENNTSNQVYGTWSQKIFSCIVLTIWSSCTAFLMHMAHTSLKI